MIILDTNVLSEITRSRPDIAVLTWMALQESRDIFTTSISQAETFFGIRAMTSGVRRDEIERTATVLFFNDLVGRVLSFDGDAADIYATISVKRRLIGRPIQELDAQIASIAILHGASLATRNVRDFEHLGLDIINPWDFRA